MHNFKELRVWKESRSFVKDVYSIGATFPADERFGITSQMRRAAVSIPLNIAEGAGRTGSLDFGRFIDMAYGSAAEVETLVYLCADLNFIDDETQNNLVIKVNDLQRMLKGLAQRLRQPV